MGFIHPTAVIDQDSSIGENTYIWQNVHIRSQAKIGSECIVGKGSFLDIESVVGNRVKIQNYVNIFRGVTIEDGVMVGPSVCFTNDMFPRAINLDGTLQDCNDWKCFKTRVKTGAGIGAGSIIVCNTTIGKWAIVGAGSVVTRDVPDYALVYGNPARVKGFVCPCGHKLDKRLKIGEVEEVTCSACKTKISLPACPELI
ncbi:acyltransferase [Desulfovibrio gilichinskyi]|uniref:Transferase hexapeptide (Six repeat-containing protein) n=1 Tax=Desulfovibrio gilichinskyi TaxID=1519643 RepID=A0A1X7EHF8_9BACT|nr:acyltransferase [Desulfovibrio gilichinskyi]SMF33922.1 transferase hexapeptide (six repeat-containing protein) [Desulfovibrio gilichinskyi]